MQRLTSKALHLHYHLTYAPLLQIYPGILWHSSVASCSKNLPWMMALHIFLPCFHSRGHTCRFLWLHRDIPMNYSKEKVTWYPTPDLELFSLTFDRVVVTESRFHL